MSDENEARRAAQQMRAKREARGWSTTVLADRARELATRAGLEIKLTQQSISKFEQGDAKRIPVWFNYAMRALAVESDHELPDLPTPEPTVGYLSVSILPTFGGMGGGGTGDDDQLYGLVPRRLIEDELHGQAEDFLLIDTRGDSMAPDFIHGDQILIDKRDRNPIQPGSFAIWDGDGYVIKIVERIPQQRGRYRIFSANTRYREFEAEEDDIKIMGRPVWVGRRL